MSLERLRHLVGCMKIIIPGIRAVIQNDDGAILLQQRGDFGTWGLPSGAVEIGESVYEALRREVYEETGLTVVHAVPFGLYTDPRCSITYPNGHQVQPFSVAFHVDAWEGVPHANGQESLSLAFFGPGDLPPDEHTHFIHLETIRDFQRRSREFIVR